MPKILLISNGNTSLRQDLVRRGHDIEMMTGAMAYRASSDGKWDYPIAVVDPPVSDIFDGFLMRHIRAQKPETRVIRIEGSDADEIDKAIRSLS